MMDSPLTNPLMSQCFFCATWIPLPFVYSPLCTFAILIPAITRLAGHVGGRFARSLWMSQYSQRCDGLELLAGEEGGKCGGTTLSYLVRSTSCGSLGGDCHSNIFFFFLFAKSGSSTFFSKIIIIKMLIIKNSTSKWF